jgi:hypothetical protein
MMRLKLFLQPNIVAGECGTYSIWARLESDTGNVTIDFGEHLDGASILLKRELSILVYEVAANPPVQIVFDGDAALFESLKPAPASQTLHGSEPAETRAKLIAVIRDKLQNIAGAGNDYCGARADEALELFDRLVKPPQRKSA